MNDTIKTLLNRKSDRVFTGERVKDEDLEVIAKAALQAPTSIGAQQISLVIVEDKEKIAKLAELSGGQPQVAGADRFILVVMDYFRTFHANRMAGKEQAIHKTTEGLLVGAVDAGIILGTLEVAIKSLGYGSTAIGGIRSQPEAVAELLNLPEYTFPIVGITVGVIDKNREAKVKPRIPVESFAFTDEYNAEKVTEGVHIYNDKMRKWWDEQGMTEMPDYVQSTSKYYSEPYFQGLKESLFKQGFGLD